jgi:hypothetical protein
MSQSADLASLFFTWSEAVDDYRDENAGTLTLDQELHLKTLSNRLDSLATEFTLAEIAETVASIQEAVGQLKAVTAQAKETLHKLKTVEQVTKVVEALAALGVAAASGNLRGVGGALGDLTKAMTPTTAGAGANG